MSVKIRMRRMGRKQHPVYALVATDSRSARDGKFIEDLGRYEPVAEPARFSVNAERVVYWLGQGAQMSDTARNLLQKEGVLMQSAMSRAGKSADEIAQAVAEFGERRAAKSPKKLTNAEKRAAALKTEREQAAAKAKELRAEQEAREAELERQRQESEDAARAEAQQKALEAAAAETAADPGAAALAATADAGLNSDLAEQQTVATEENDAEASPEPMGDVSAAPSPVAGADQGDIQGTKPLAAIVAETTLLPDDAPTTDFVGDDATETASTGDASTTDAGAADTSGADTPGNTAEAENTPGTDAAAQAGEDVAETQAAIEAAGEPGADSAVEAADASTVADAAPDAAEEQPATTDATSDDVAATSEATVVSQADAGAAEGNDAPAEGADDATGDAAKA